LRCSVASCGSSRVEEAIEQRAGETLIAENARPFVEWKVGADDRRSMLMTLAEDFQMAEIAIPRSLFADILQLIAELRLPPLKSTG
jgi:hypothetical protein